MSKKFIDLANLKSNLENFLSEIITPTFATKEGVSKQLGNHTVKSDVPENAVFTDTIYDDTEVKESIDEINSNLVLLAKSDKGISNNICGAYGKYYYPLSVGDVLTISKKDSSVSILESNIVRLNQYDANGNKVDYWQLHDDALPRTVTISKKSVYIGFNKDTTDTPLMVNVGSSAMTYEPYIPSVKTLAEENTQQSTEMMDIKMVGWSIPRECPIQNEVNGNQFIQKVGRVDLGSLSWIYDSSIPRFYSGDLQNFIKKVKSESDIFSGYLKDYNNLSLDNLFNSVKDKAIAESMDGTLSIVNLSYIDASAFKSAMQGQYLYYELATYNTMTIDGNEIGETVSDVRKETTVNLLNPTLQTTTINGVTCTANGDGTYTLKGKSTSSSNTNFVMSFFSPFKGKCKLIGCPSGIDSIAELQCNYNEIWESKNTDHGKGSILDSANLLTAIAIVIFPNVSVNNLIFKPMITTNLNATYDDFVPYTGSTGQINSDVAEVRKDFDEHTHEIADVIGLQSTLDEKADKEKYGDTVVSVGRKANTTIGDSSFAEGANTTASGSASHAEGRRTIASGAASHAEGGVTTASGPISHAEGSRTTASGDYSHAEGYCTTASASYTHSEGVNTSAIGQGSHAEGSNLEQNIRNEIVFEDPRRVEVYDKATDDFINITVAGSQAFGLNSHAEGCSTLAYGKNSHTEGYHTVAAANESHAEGCGCEAHRPFAHAEGQDTTANGNGAHAEGLSTIANGSGAHAEGFSTAASGTYSHAEGYYTKAANHASHASGKYNTAMTTGGASSNTTGTAFVIGNGTSSSALSNAFSVQYSGIVKAKSTITASTTADYAEFFEWLDKNPNEEDRVGHFVTLDGDKIKIATSEDDYILGIVSGEPFVLGNGDCDTWNGMFLHDEFRRTMYEPAPKMIEILDSEGNPTGEYEEVEGEYEGTRPILNPDYDPTQEYVSRFDRVEWSPVGMLGVLAVLHDGTAEVNGYVTVNNEGIATKCTRDTRNSYRVIKKVSDKVVEVIFR